MSPSPFGEVESFNSGELQIVHDNSGRIHREIIKLKEIQESINSIRPLIIPQIDVYDPLVGFTDVCEFNTGSLSVLVQQSQTNLIISQIDKTLLSVVGAILILNQSSTSLDGIMYIPSYPRSDFIPDTKIYDSNKVIKLGAPPSNWLEDEGFIGQTRSRRWKTWGFKSLILKPIKRVSNNLEKSSSVYTPYESSKKGGNTDDNSKLDNNSKIGVGKVLTFNQMNPPHLGGTFDLITTHRTTSSIHTPAIIKDDKIILPPNFVLKDEFSLPRNLLYSFRNLLEYLLIFIKELIISFIFLYSITIICSGLSLVIYSRYLANYTTISIKVDRTLTEGE